MNEDFTPPETGVADTPVPAPVHGQPDPEAAHRHWGPLWRRELLPCKGIATTRGSRPAPWG